jgi:hypothetical protein
MVEPPVLVAVTVYPIVAVICVGFPEITPVVGSAERPCGSEVYEYDTTAPPIADTDGVFGGIVVFTVYTAVLVPYAHMLGGLSLTVMWRGFDCVEPPVFCAVTV